MSSCCSESVLSITQYVLCQWMLNGIFFHYFIELWEAVVWEYESPALYMEMTSFCFKTPSEWLKICTRGFTAQSMIFFTILTQYLKVKFYLNCEVFSYLPQLSLLLWSPPLLKSNFTHSTLLQTDIRRRETTLTLVMNEELLYLLLIRGNHEMLI